MSKTYGHLQLKLAITLKNSKHRNSVCYWVMPFIDLCP